MFKIFEPATPIILLWTKFAEQREPYFAVSFVFNHVTFRRAMIGLR